MPIPTRSICPAWKDYTDAVPAQHPLEFGRGKDSGGPLIILEFKYDNEKFHFTMPVGQDGMTSCFHVTADDMNSEYLAGKSSGPKYIKNQPSAYYDFRISKTPQATPKVEISAAKHVHVEGEKAGKWDAVAVTSAKPKPGFERDIKALMEGFIEYIMGDEELGGVYDR